MIDENLTLEHLKSHCGVTSNMSTQDMFEDFLESEDYKEHRGKVIEFVKSKIKDEFMTGDLEKKLIEEYDSTEGVEQFKKFWESFVRSFVKPDSKKN